VLFLSFFLGTSDYLKVEQMNTTQDRVSNRFDLESRIQYLEDINRQTLDALDQAAQLGDFQTSINKLHSQSLILEEVRARVLTLVPFEAVAFYLVDEATSEFYLENCSPGDYRPLIQSEVDNFIDNGTFAWAMREQRPLFLPAADRSKKILLHVMTTSSRVRGMFVGVLTHGEMDVPLISLSMLSIIFRYSANALESFELYNMIKTMNANLEQMVEKRTGKLQYRLKFENLVSGISASFVNIPPEKIINTIVDGLRAITQFVGASNYFISFFEENDDLTCCIESLPYASTPAPADAFLITKADEFPDFAESFKKKKSLFIPNISCLPDPGGMGKGFFSSIGAGSAVVIPMISGGVSAGFFGFVLNEAESRWADEIDRLLIIVGEIFINALGRVKTEIDLQNSREQLRHAQKMEALGQLAGGVAHDFNNILTSIIIASEVSLASPGVQDKIALKFREILKSAERGSNLTRQLLAISRKQIIKPRLLDVGNIIFELNKMLTRLISEDIEIILESAQNLLSIKADPGQVEQVLINLAVNARDAISDNPSAGAEKKIHISVSSTELGEDAIIQNIVPRQGAYILIRVSDTGMGIEKEIINRVFEPFFTTKNEGKGTGLGLATVYGIVKQNEGGITVESEPGRGTTFCVYWPAVNTTAVEMEKPAVVKFKTGGDETILLVEDDETVREAVEDYLLAVGYTVITAQNGKTALEIAESHEKETGGTVHLVLTDVMMPEMNGRELADIMRKRLPGIKIVFTTGYSDDPLSITENLPPDSRFIQKPYSVRELSKLIRDLLDGN
jgi:signal transduction histidine kinase